MNISYLDQREYCLFSVVHVIEKRGKEGSTKCPIPRTFPPRQTTFLVLVRNY